MNSTSRTLRTSLFGISLHSEIDIAANPARIWQALTDFSAYSSWNPAITQAEGRPIPGTMLKVVIQWPGLKSGPYELEILDALPERELRWLGHMGRKGLMDGDHRFVIEPSGEGRSKLVQSEKFSGLLVPFFAPWLKKNVLVGFEQINAALKARLECPAGAGKSA